MKKVILLDRDGVINRDSLHYIRSVDDFVFLPGSKEAIAQLSKAGFQIGIATNQSGVARGYYSVQVLEDIHQKLRSEIEAAGGHIAAIEYCLHMPDAGCDCRKPQPGLLKRLAKQFDIELAQVPFVGDRISDIQAARAAGASPILVLSTMTDQSGLLAYPDVPVYNSLQEYVHCLLAS